MRKSKLLFFIIAAIVVAVIVIVLFFAPKLPVVDPTGPSGSSGTNPSTGEPEPSTTYPTSSGTSPDLFPTEPTFPRETFVPEETDPSDLPPSDGVLYKNLSPVRIAMKWDYLKETLFYVQFGVEIGKANYLCLSPTVLTNDGNWYKLFQFTFEPADGYITTITTAEKDKYNKAGSVVFDRALDYGLPAEYVDENNMGVVWYMPEGQSLERGASTYVDVRVHANGVMLATLRIVIVRSTRDGLYYTDRVINLNQLENAGTAAGGKLTEAQLSALMSLAWADAYSADYQCNLGGSVTKEYKASDFIIEWRDPGKGTYFSYTSALTGRYNFIASEDLDDTALIAVTHRRNRWDVQYAPVTLYYKVVEGENGDTVYELVGIDHHYHYWSYYLYYDGYPGYSLPEIEG